MADFIILTLTLTLIAFVIVGAFLIFKGWVIGGCLLAFVGIAMLVFFWGARI